MENKIHKKILEAGFIPINPIDLPPVKLPCINAIAGLDDQFIKEVFNEDTVINRGEFEPIAAFQHRRSFLNVFLVHRRLRIDSNTSIKGEKLKQLILDLFDQYKQGKL